MNWEQRDLPSVYWFQEGPGVRKWQFTNEGIKLLNVANITVDGELVLDKTDKYLSLEEIEEHYQHFLVDAGDLVIASSGISFDADGYLRTRGAFIENKHLPLCMNTSTIRFKAIEGQSDLRLLKYWLDSEEFREQITRLVTGSAQQNFGPSHLKQLKISLPPLDEQKRIVTILEEADHARRTRRFTQSLSDTFLQETLIEMFGDPITNPMGWEEANIGNIVAISQYGTSEKSNQERIGYPILGMGNITYDGLLDLTDYSYVDLPRSEFEKMHLQQGDIIFNRTNSTELVGKTAMWNLNMDAVLASYLVKLKLKPRVLPEYFVGLLNTHYYKALFQMRCKKAVGQSNVSPTLLKEFPIMLPPQSMQRDYAATVHEYHANQAKQQESTRQAEHLFQTLLHQAFRGEL